MIPSFSNTPRAYKVLAALSCMSLLKLFMSPPNWNYSNEGLLKEMDGILPESQAVAPQRPDPACFVNNSFESRERWISGDGFVMLHHIRRAGGSTLCGILADDDNPLRSSNCLLNPHTPAEYSLRNFKSLASLESEMIRQGTRVVAVEGYNLPEWFLADPLRRERWTIVTAIRDPVDRLVSISKTKCKDNPEKCWNAGIDLTTRFPLENTFVRSFAGGNLVSPKTNVTEADLQRAIANLENEYQIIIITEWLPEMAPIFKYWLGIERSGNLRRGLGGNHSTKATNLGQKSVLHHLPESSAKVYLQDRPGLYEKMVQEHAFDARLLDHFREREKWRANNCILFRTTNLERPTLNSDLVTVRQ
jgi:hypothetical protein